MIADVSDGPRGATTEAIHERRGKKDKNLWRKTKPLREEGFLHAEGATADRRYIVTETGYAALS